MNKLEQCEHIKNMPFNVVIQSIGWQVDGIQYSVCHKCYIELLKAEKEKSNIEKLKVEEQFK